jgi:two-component sensor histidine kinase
MSLNEADLNACTHRTVSATVTQGLCITSKDIYQMMNKPVGDKAESLLRREKALATFGTFAFREPNLQAVLNEAARVCAACLGVPFSKICKYQPTENNLRVVAGCGWKDGVVGYAISVADKSSPQGRAFITGKPQFCANIAEVTTYSLPAFYPEHKILSTVDILIAAKDGPPFGVLEVDSEMSSTFDEHDIDFLTGFANILAEAVVTSARAAELRKTIVRMEELIAEKETLSQELKHRVRNSLHLVYGLLTAELHGKHDASSMLAFRAIAFRVMGLAQIFDHLLGVGMSRVINFGEYVRALCNNLPDLYGTKDIKLLCTADAVGIELDTATALGIVVTELVNNAYLHAFPDGIGEISVALRVASGQVSLIIADNGTGFVEVETTRRGMGLVKRLVQQVGGTLNLQPGHGRTWIILFPLEKAIPLAAK